jgi:hypothetical protein
MRPDPNHRDSKDELRATVLTQEVVPAEADAPPARKIENGKQKMGNESAGIFIAGC